jgi:hypothetical protein
MRASVARLAPGVKWWGMRHRVSAPSRRFQPARSMFHASQIPAFGAEESIGPLRAGIIGDEGVGQYEYSLRLMGFLYDQANELLRLTHASRENHDVYNKSGVARITYTMYTLDREETPRLPNSTNGMWKTGTAHEVGIRARTKMGLSS